MIYSAFKVYVLSARVSNRTRDLAVSCTCSSGWVMCLERIWEIELNVNRKESAEASHRHREVLTETVEIYDRSREFRGRVRIVFLQQRSAISDQHWIICFRSLTFTYTEQSSSFFATRLNTKSIRTSYFSPEVHL